MKKTHLILLVVTGLMILFSAYSLAAINQVYKVKFDWYSTYKNEFINENRLTYQDKWMISNYPKSLEFKVINKKLDVNFFAKGSLIKNNIILKNDFEKYILLYCTLGEVNSTDYRIKITDIAQRGSVVEIKVSINSPVRISEDNSRKYIPEDVVKVDKIAFAEKGKLYFVFKDQYGRELKEIYCNVK